MPLKTQKFAWLVGGLLVSALLKMALLLADVVPLNSDEAIVALMARHMLQGSFPVFFYGQAYMGSLDAMLVALGFLVFGQHAWVIRHVQVLLYLGTIITTALLGEKIFRRWQVGALAAWLLAIPTVNTTLYTTASLGGYGEALLLGNLLMLAGLGVAGQGVGEERPARLAGRFAWMGLLVGVGVWAFGLTLVFSIPVAIMLLFWAARHVRAGMPLPHLLGLVAVGLAGLALGAFPWLWFAVNRGLDVLLFEMGGGAIAGVGGLSVFDSVLQHLFSFLVLGTTVILGFRPPWEIRWLALPLIPFVLMFWAAVFWRVLGGKKGLPEPALAVEVNPGQGLLKGVMAALVIGFVFTPFGADPSGRYFLPLAVPMALFAAAFIDSLKQHYGGWALGLVVMVLVFHLAGNVQSALRYPPGITTQFYPVTWVDHRHIDALQDFLKENGEVHGYTNYWVAYPLAFESAEELVYVPALPYHLDFRYTSRDNRYALYQVEVDSAERAAYITTHHPELNERLRAGFTALGVTWKETRIGDYDVFYALSEKVEPRDLDLNPSP